MEGIWANISDNTPESSFITCLNYISMDFYRITYLQLLLGITEENRILSEFS